MKKITILALGGAGENFLNSIEKDFKKDIVDIEFNLFHLEEKSFSKLKLEKNINKSSGIFVVFGMGSNSKLSLILADILDSLSCISNFIVLKPFSFEDKEKLALFENITQKLSKKVENLKIIDCDDISSQSFDEDISIQDIFLNIDKHIFEYILK
ncbi:hypothetical protein NG751_04695 [Aliarcobacter cryaerophilus]|uniref:hypothetical protein n=1 Tax=Aliarcobacter cryaerophilus TaxID=28198 RepID=UPI003DA441C7